MSRIKPYTSNQQTWNSILNNRFRIPMNQREYSWEEKEIVVFLDDLYNTYEEGTYVEKMGSIINLNYDNNNEIYDGQQRILTTSLCLIVMGDLSPETLKTEINNLLTINLKLNKLTPELKKMKEDNPDIKLIPKIYCINPVDRKGLVNIYNNKINSWAKYILNINDFNSFEEEQTYTCNICNVNISRKGDFKKHLIRQHKDIYLNDTTDTKLYNAYITIYNYFLLKKYDENKLIDLYHFITEEIDIQYYNCTDPVYVSRIFDWENNRGKIVQSLDIIKNRILVNIPDGNKEEIYVKWEKLRLKKYKFYNNYGKEIFDIAIQVYNNKIERVIDIETCFKVIIENDTYKKINEFFSIVEKLFEIMDKITLDRYGRLVNNTPNVRLNWEAYKWFLLPIFHKTNNINTDVIKLFTIWYFRNLQFNNLNFNNLTYSNEFIKITNEVLKNKDYDYYTEINNCLSRNKDNSINEENYKEQLKDMNFKSTKATHLLLFLETCLTTDLNTVSLEYTLEHIYPQKNIKLLSNQSLMDNIGNLTLIEGKNSDNGHKGNSSLGAKPYIKKKPSYAGSSSTITRDVAKKYEDFTEESIKNRNKELVDLLHIHTNY
jgi:hypothetical protein